MEIIKPTLLLDPFKCQRNLQNMIDKANLYNLNFRPHFKTHQSKNIANWFRDKGVDKITVSSIDMAEYFIDDGWDDITIAFPFNRLEIDKLIALNQRAKINILIVDVDSLDILKMRLTEKIGFYIKIDTGYHRSGIEFDQFDQIDKILFTSELIPQLEFKGFLTHSGNSYNVESPMQLEEIHKDTLIKMINLKNKYSTILPNVTISIGDTPCCKMMTDFEGVDEIRPGNFIFHDLMQQRIGSCAVDEIAVAVACPIVQINESRCEFVLYGGAAHLSKESVKDQMGEQYFGKVVDLFPYGWMDPYPETYLRSLSQEHGIVKTTPQLISRFKIGDVLGVLPVHSCLTANLMKHYHTLDNKVFDHFAANS